MTLVQFRNGRNVAMFDVAGSRTWTLPITGQAGVAKYRIPYKRHPNLRNVINPEGGSQLMVPEQTAGGPWFGVITQVDFDIADVVVTAHQPWIILGKRYVSANRTFKGQNAGYIWGRALREALGGMGGFNTRYTTLSDSAPNIPEYTFTGQDLMSVAQDLMAISGMELMHALDSPILQWGGVHARSMHWPTLFVEGSSLKSSGYSVSITDRVSSVVSRNNEGRTYTAFYADVAANNSWPAQLGLQSPNENPSQILTNAHFELLRLMQAGVKISGGIPRSAVGAPGLFLWDVRERYFVRVFFPRARFSGATLTCRIFGRTLSDDSDLMTLDMQVVSDPADQLHLPRPTGTVRQRSARGGGPLHGRFDIHDLRRRIFDLEARR